MKYTFKDACEYIADTVKNGLSPSSEAVKKRVNRCQQDLLMRLEAQYKRQFMMLYAHDGVITCPASVERIVKHSVENVGRQIYSESYQFLEYGPGAQDRLNNGRHGDLVDLGSSYVTYYDPHTPMKLMAFSDSPNDIDVTIHVAGAAQDTFLPNVTTFENEGHVEAEIKVVPRFSGLTSMLWDPAKASAQSFTRIDALVKPATVGNIVLVGWIENDAGSPSIFALGKYGRSEKVPNYRRYRISGNTEGEMIGVYALVQLAHTELVNDNDLLIIQNLTAFEMESRSAEAMNVDQGRGVHLQNAAAKRVRDQLKNNYVESTEITFDVDCVTGPRGL